MDILDIYFNPIPDFIRAIADTRPLQRLRGVGMNCGCEYSSVHTFCRIGNYSRFEHSIGAGLIVWKFTADVRQTVSALLHDIATPCFAHVIDFLHGDYESQESTEDRTLEMIREADDLVSVLDSLGLKPEEVCDYHLFPIADNDTPRLSSDRLEYTIGNAVNFGFITKEKAAEIFNCLEADVNGEGEPELVFTDAGTALEFAELALRCSKIYCGDEDRYLMQILAELVRDCIDKGVIEESDLHRTEDFVTGKMLADPRTSASWRHFRGIKAIKAGADGISPRVISAKKRHINPYVKGRGRVTQLYPEFQAALKEYLTWSFDYPVSEVPA